MRSRIWSRKHPDDVPGSLGQNEAELSVVYYDLNPKVCWRIRDTFWQKRPPLEKVWILLTHSNYSNSKNSQRIAKKQERAYLIHRGNSVLSSHKFWNFFSINSCSMSPTDAPPHPMPLLYILHFSAIFTVHLICPWMCWCYLGTWNTSLKVFCYRIPHVILHVLENCTKDWKTIKTTGLFSKVSLNPVVFSALPGMDGLMLWTSHLDSLRTWRKQKL